jgi:hypothetical protein
MLKGEAPLVTVQAHKKGDVYVSVLAEVNRSRTLMS